MAVVPRKTDVIDRLKRAGRDELRLPGPPTVAGIPGEDGTDGRAAGLRYTWSTNTEASAPATGGLKKNAGATILRINETDADGNALQEELASWDDSDSTIKGKIIIRQIGAPSRFATYSLTAREDNGGYNTLTVALVASGEALVNGADVMVEFIRTGDKGTKGDTGPEGVGKEGPAGSIENTDWKNSVRVATTANIAIATALNPGDSIDGVVLAENDRVLVKDQTTKKENGIWVVKAVPVRAIDADAVGELSAGTSAYIDLGTRNKRRIFQVITTAAITPGTTEHEWAQLGVRFFGLVEALPTAEALAGDRCAYLADKAKGIVWDLVYVGEGEFPWTKVGGRPLRAFSDTERKLKNKAYTSLPTDPLKITAPLKGDYDICIEAMLSPGGGGVATYLSYAIGATVASDNWCISNLGSAASMETDLSKTTPQLSVAAAAVIEEKAKCSGENEAYFRRRRLWVDPIRVG